MVFTKTLFRQFFSCFFTYIPGCILLLFGTVYAQDADSFIVKGTIDSVPGAKYYMLYAYKDSLIRDSITLDSNKMFTLKGRLYDPDRLYIQIKNPKNPNFYIPIYMIWIEPGKTIYFEGGRHTENARVYHHSRKVRNSEIDSVYWDYVLREEETIGHLKKEKETYNEQQKKFGKAFVSENLCSFYSVYLLSFMIRESQPDYTFIRKSLEGLCPAVKKTFLAQQTIQELEVKETLREGHVLPEFSLPDSTSTPVALSSLKGKYVLVDFWASWCIPCRKEMPLLVEMYKKYKDRNFEILGVSLDHNQKEWIRAIQQDKQSWVQVIDQQGPGSGISEKFYIRGIPDNFLVDPNGVIVARYLRGDNLKKKLQEIFEENQINN